MAGKLARISLVLSLVAIALSVLAIILAAAR
jgi:hypothetical protein